MYNGTVYRGKKEQTHWRRRRNRTATTWAFRRKSSHSASFSVSSTKKQFFRIRISKLFLPRATTADKTKSIAIGLVYNPKRIISNRKNDFFRLFIENAVFLTHPGQDPRSVVKTAVARFGNVTRIRRLADRDLLGEAIRDQLRFFVLELVFVFHLQAPLFRAAPVISPSRSNFGDIGEAYDNSILCRI